MTSRYKAIHFDMDGVLANTEPFHVLAEQETCRNFNFDIDPKQWGGFKGRTATDIFAHLIQEYGDPEIHRPENMIAHKTDVFIESLQGKLQPIEGSMEFLEWARQEHEVVSLVTSSNRRVEQFITATFGIAKLFDTIITGDDITEGKPSPQPYQMALGQLGVSGSESIVIEDSKSGIASGLAAGCHVLGIATSHSAAELAAARPTYVAADYVAARKMLEAA